MKIYTFSLNIQRITTETDLQKVVDSLMKEEVVKLQDVPPEYLRQALTLIGQRDVMAGEEVYLNKDRITMKDFLGRHGLTLDHEESDENPWVTDEFLSEMGMDEFIHSKLTIRNRNNGKFIVHATTNPEAEPLLILEYVSVLSRFYELCDRDFETWHTQTRIRDLEGAEHRFQWIKYNADGMKNFLSAKWYYEFIHGIEKSRDWSSY